MRKKLDDFVKYRKMKADFRANRSIHSLNSDLEREMPSVGKIKRKKMRR